MAGLLEHCSSPIPTESNIYYNIMIFEMRLRTIIISKSIMPHWFAPIWSRIRMIRVNIIRYLTSSEKPYFYIGRCPFHGVYSSAMRIKWSSVTSLGSYYWATRVLCSLNITICTPPFPSRLLGILISHRAIRISMECLNILFIVMHSFNYIDFSLMWPIIIKI